MLDRVRFAYKHATTRSTGVLGECARALKAAGALSLGAATDLSQRRAATLSRTILFESYLGERIDGNPKAVFDYLRNSSCYDYEFAWVAERPDDWGGIAGLPHTRVVKYRSAEHRRYALLAGTLVCDSPRPNELVARKNQLQIQTWHGGGCYKKVGIGANGFKPVSNWLTRRKSARYDYFISSSRFFTDEVVRKQYAFGGRVLECGMPRNDRLIDPRPTERARLRSSLGLSGEDHLVLFVPTWRDFSDDVPQIDPDAARKAFEDLTSKQQVMAQRGHYLSRRTGNGFDRDFTDYPDMQGLLLAADALITDYSSVIWDFSFTYRPCFLYCPDLAAYERDRGFDVPIHEWGFPVCETSRALAQAIRDYDPAVHKAAMEHHHAALGSYETGHACEVVAKVIEEHVRSIEEGGSR